VSIDPQTHRPFGLADIPATRQLSSGLAQHIENCPRASISLIDSNRALRVHPLAAQGISIDNKIWFMVSRAEFEPLFTADEQAVNLSFVEEDRTLVASVAGTATLIDDLSMKIKLWFSARRHNFNGPDDPDLTLLRVSPHSAEVALPDDARHGLIQAGSFGPVRAASAGVRRLATAGTRQPRAVQA